MKDFLGDDFLLQTQTACRLYHEVAAKIPIFDYHCHLPVRDIAMDRRFENLTQIWLAGDHYKWRAMRCCGVDEKYITGDASDQEKFLAWAAVVPQTIRNPLYHWTHLELKRPFGITGKLLNAQTGPEIYDTCNALLATKEFSVRGILNKMDVSVVCTTDDPLDDVKDHERVRQDPSFQTRVLPTFRPDNAMKIDDSPVFNQWVDRLIEITRSDVNSYESFLAALEARVVYFHNSGCRISDHANEVFCFENATVNDLNRIFLKARKGEQLSSHEVSQFTSQTLVELCRMYAAHNWVQQFHLGALRNTNTRMFHSAGPDSGFDTMDDRTYAGSLATFMDTLDQTDQLAKTILYNLNPRDNEMLATMIGNFQNGKIPGKIQFGSGWWFNDQKNGMERQLNTLSTMGILGVFVGMVTDSRSFLSYPRHEYFRRILCNLLGNDMERGEIPNDLEMVKELIENICYHNAERYFRLGV